MSNSQCSARYLKTGRIHRCISQGSVQREEIWFCRRHDPDTQESQRAERERARLEQVVAAGKLREEWARRREAETALCEGMATETLEELGKGWVEEMLNLPEWQRKREKPT